MKFSAIMFTVIAAGSVYAIGFHQGRNRTVLMDSPPQQVVIAPYPNAAVCDAMLEAAFSIENYP